MIDKAQKKALVIQSQSLKAIIIVGSNGITDNIIHEADQALEAHELIKIRINAEDRLARRSMVEEIAARTGSHIIQTIGHVASFYRKKTKKN